MKKIINIVFVILATLIGAGFASGKEIYLYFFIYGKTGLFGIIISSAIIGYTIYKSFKICSENNINTYQEFCKVLDKGRHSRF